MTEKLFANLRVVFGSRSKKQYDQQMLCWAKTEYGSDWEWAYQQILSTGKPPVKGINY